MVFPSWSTFEGGFISHRLGRLEKGMNQDKSPSKQIKERRRWRRSQKMAMYVPEVAVPNLTV